MIVGDKSLLSDWIETLQRLRALRPALIVPGHGPIQRDDSWTTLLGEMLGSARQQTGEAVARGETLEQARKSVRLDRFRAQVADDDPSLSFLFSNYFVAPAVLLGYREAGGRE